MYLHTQRCMNTKLALVIEYINYLNFLMFNVECQMLLHVSKHRIGTKYIIHVQMHEAIYTSSATPMSKNIVTIRGSFAGCH
jgi:hypothetical protein